MKSSDFVDRMLLNLLINYRIDNINLNLTLQDMAQLERALEDFLDNDKELRIYDDKFIHYLKNYEKYEIEEHEFSDDIKEYSLRH